MLYISLRPQAFSEFPRFPFIYILVVFPSTLPLERLDSVHIPSSISFLRVSRIELSIFPFIYLRYLYFPSTLPSERLNSVHILFVHKLPWTFPAGLNLIGCSFLEFQAPSTVTQPWFKASPEHPSAANRNCDTYNESYTLKTVFPSFYERNKLPARCFPP